MKGRRRQRSRCKSSSRRRLMKSLRRWKAVLELGMIRKRILGLIWSLMMNKDLIKGNLEELLLLLCSHHLCKTQKSITIALNDWLRLWSKILNSKYTLLMKKKVKEPACEKVSSIDKVLNQINFIRKFQIGVKMMFTCQIRLICRHPIQMLQKMHSGMFIETLMKNIVWPIMLPICQGRVPKMKFLSRLKIIRRICLLN